MLSDRIQYQGKAGFLTEFCNSQNNTFRGMRFSGVTYQSLCYDYVILQNLMDLNLCHSISTYIATCYIPSPSFVDNFISHFGNSKSRNCFSIISILNVLSSTMILQQSVMYDTQKCIDQFT